MNTSASGAKRGWPSRGARGIVEGPDRLDDGERGMSESRVGGAILSVRRRMACDGGQGFGAKHVAI